MGSENWRLSGDLEEVGVRAWSWRPVRRDQRRILREGLGAAEVGEERIGCEPSILAA